MHTSTDSAQLIVPARDPEIPGQPCRRRVNRSVRAGNVLPLRPGSDPVFWNQIAPIEEY